MRMSTSQGPAKGRGRDAMGFGLAILNRLARLRDIDHFGLRKPAERVVFEATRTGFKTLGAANRTFKAVQQLGKPARLPAASSSGLFDLTPTEDQQLVVDVVKEFASEQLRPAAP